MTVDQLKTVSRRGFIGLAAAAALVLSPLRRLQGSAGGGSAEAAAGEDLPTLQYALTGGWTPNGFLVTAQLDPGVSTQLAVSTTDDMQHIVTTVGPVTSNATDGLARFTVVVPDSYPGVVTRYFCQLQDPATGAFFGDIFSGWTRMTDDDTVDYSFDIVLGSCLANPKFVNGQQGSTLALADAAALEAPLLLHLGDWGYWGQDIDVPPVDDYTKDLKQYSDTMAAAKFPDLRTLVHGSNIEICISDHELHSNGDIWKSDGENEEEGETEYDGDEPDAFGCAHSKRQISAHRRLFPVRNWGDIRPVPAVHRGYFLDLAPHVRLVVSDFRSPERNESADPDGGSTYKQMWGATQEQWLYEEAFDVAEDVVILFVNETVWWRRADNDVTDDKPASYPDAQKKFMDRLTGTGDYQGYPSIIDRFIWLGGDRHYCGYLSRTDAQPPLGDGFPQFIGSGFCKNSLYPHPNENMSWRSPVRPDPFAWFPVVGYTKLTLAYDHTTNTVSLTGTPRIVEKTHRELYSGSVTDGSETITLDPQAHESFLASDLNQTITGRFIPEEPHGSDETPDAVPVTIAEVVDDLTATISGAATGTRSNVTFAIGTDKGQWSISTPPDGVWTETIPV